DGAVAGPAALKGRPIEISCLVQRQASPRLQSVQSASEVVKYVVGLCLRPWDCHCQRSPIASAAIVGQRLFPKIRNSWFRSFAMTILLSNRLSELSPCSNPQSGRNRLRRFVRSHLCRGTCTRHATWRLPVVSSSKFAKSSVCSGNRSASSCRGLVGLSEQ